MGTECVGPCLISQSGGRKKTRVCTCSSCCFPCGRTGRPREVTETAAPGSCAQEWPLLLNSWSPGVFLMSSDLPSKALGVSYGGASRCLKSHRQLCKPSLALAIRARGGPQPAECLQPWCLGFEGPLLSFPQRCRQRSHIAGATS